ncbi:MAG: hypothetical protein R3A51_02545 [Nannocystaceae bacterium]
MQRHTLIVWITSGRGRCVLGSLLFAIGLAVGSWHLGCIVCYDLEWQGTTDEELPEHYRCEETPAPCPELRVIDFGRTCEGGETPYDPALGACIVASLRAGEPGTHIIQENCAPFEEVWTIHVFDDGDALWSFQKLGDFNYRIHETWRKLPEPEYFDACDAGTLESLLACIEGIAEESCASGSPPCSKS